MKKRVLFFACLGMLFSLGVKAQTFNCNVTDVTTFPYTQGGITLSTDATRATESNGMGYLNIGSNAIRIKLSSASNIKKVTIFFRGGGNSSVTTGVIASSTAEGNTLTDRASGSVPAGGVLVTNLVKLETTVLPDGEKYIEIRRGVSSSMRVYQIIAGDADYVLPLDLLSFSAKPDALGKSVNLNWKTANEVNTQDFLVERRTDDTEFTTVGTVLSKNVAGTHNYSFTDLKPVAGNSYYRLKQRDKDGKSSYSDIANVKIDGIALSLYPNPVSKELVVSHDYVKQSASLKVIGLDGKTHIKTNSAAGSSSTTINVASLASGTYLLVHDVNGKAQSQKFIKK